MTHLVTRTFCAAVIAVTVNLATPITAQNVPPGALPFGVYDPYGEFSDQTDVMIEHLFLPWEDVFLPSLAEAETYAKARGRTLLVTIEPWTWTRDERNSPAVLQKGIAEGTYDETMRVVCQALATIEVPLTIRWAQEMDDESGQFIWAGWPPQTYIDAYRRMTGICRAAAPKAKFMWSPLGNEDMARYYPGDDHVDIVGLSVFSLQDFEQATLGKAQSFDEIFAPRYQRALQFNKPIMIAELGYVGDADHVAAWDGAVRNTAAAYPRLEAVVYFNQHEVYPWPDGFGLPDWRRSAHLLN